MATKGTMQSPLAELPAPELAAPPPTVDPHALSEAAQLHERRNFFALALYQIVMRIGWIFKTESIVMPAVLDTITGGGPQAGLLRGCLPVLNRLGHSLPPLLVSRRLKLLPRKSIALAGCTVWMALMFALLSGMWYVADGRVLAWMPPLFLVCYGSFFMATGVSNLAFGTLQGKLIPAVRRGRLMLAANCVGAVLAIAAVAFLMPAWLTPTGGKFVYIFGFTAFCFAVAAIVVVWMEEPRDAYQDPARGVRHLFASAWAIVRTDSNFRTLACVATAFSSSLLLFPHYQALGRSDALQLSFDNLMIWLIIQNAGTALFSLAAGPVADRFGNRIVLVAVMLGISSTPIVAITLSYFPDWGSTLYPGVFLLVGLTPVGFKTFSNYTLEISPPSEHARYLSTLGLCYAVPLVFSPAVGWIVETVGFTPVFLSVTGVVLVGWSMTLGLEEPRPKRSP